jgi:hypothetical protein
MDKKGLGGLIVVLVVSAALIGIGLLPTLSHHIAVQEHQPTTATVQGTDIEVTEDDDGDKSYTPKVTYAYTVDGETYSSANVFPGQFDRSSGNRGWAEAIVNDYSQSDEVEIQYGPRKPSKAYLRNDEGLPDTWWIGAAYIPVGILAGGHYIRVGFKRRKQRELMEDTPTEEAESLSVGPSEIKGTAVTEDREPAPAPFSADDCVVAKYEVKEYREDNDDDGGGSWNTIEEGVRHTPFYVDDGTGAVLVRPDDETTYDLEPEDWSTTYVDSSDRGPEPVQRFVQQSSEIGFPSNGGGKENDRKYRQNLVEVEEDVYIFGTAQPKDDVPAGADNADRLVIEKVGEDGTLMEPMFMISDDEETDLVDRREFALWRLPVGVLFVLAGVSCAVGIFGPQNGIPLPILF